MRFISGTAFGRRIRQRTAEWVRNYTPEFARSNSAKGQAQAMNRRVDALLTVLADEKSASSSTADQVQALRSEPGLPRNSQARLDLLERRAFSALGSKTVHELTSLIGRLSLERDAYSIDGRPVPPELECVARAIDRRLPFSRLLEDNLKALGEQPIEAAQGNPAVRKDFWVDLARAEYSIPDDMYSGELHTRDIEQVGGRRPPAACAEFLQSMVERLALKDIGQFDVIARYAHQGVWSPLQTLSRTPSSPFVVDGVPGRLRGEPLASYSIAPAVDGDFLIDCRLDYPSTLEFLPHDNSTEGRPLTSDSRASATMQLKVSADGRATISQAPRFEIMLKAESPRPVA
ncbi:hypothetical protein JI739_00255 [Ramlibacter sp. AW1]|uniref:Uncharacterized protein n=1 Tax=Ramlibacter aurantiacus TaxID=2801330 RepID=A0A936ZC01_9BURK|nr:hypothetical protein [Ramlibacter aurantiacus]MBL0418764.1 hypothetical protein [Ramlibacter aurantiacus]